MCRRCVLPKNARRVAAQPLRLGSGGKEMKNNGRGFRDKRLIPHVAAPLNVEKGSDDQLGPINVIFVQAFYRNAP